MQSLREKINNRSAVVAVIGVGYVGLPLCMEMARAGYTVIGLDVDSRKVESLNAGLSHIGDISSEEVAEFVKSGHFRASTNFDDLRSCDAVSICVPTPLNKTKDPDISYIVKATESIETRLHPDMLIILESTTYPGTTHDLVLPMLTRTGLKVGQDFFLAFSPERVDPGQSRWTIKNTPKVIGGETAACTEMATLLYGSFIDRMVPVTSTQSAETVKLLENTFRAVNIALVNEVAIIARKLNLDVWEIIDGAASKPFGFMPFYPGPGLGGHCLPIDPLYLSWVLKSLNYNARFIELASTINGQMPGFVVELVQDALNDQKKSLNGARVLVLGVAYKRDISDMRESPALDIIHDLRLKKAEVAYHDPYVPELEVDGHRYASVGIDGDALQGYDCVVICTDHRCFDYQTVVNGATLVLDTRNATKNVTAGREKIRRL